MFAKVLHAAVAVTGGGDEEEDGTGINMKVSISIWIHINTTGCIDTCTGMHIDINMNTGTCHIRRCLASCSDDAAAGAAGFPTK